MALAMTVAIAAAAEPAPAGIDATSRRGGDAPAIEAGAAGGGDEWAAWCEEVGALTRAGLVDCDALTEVATLFIEGDADAEDAPQDDEADAETAETDAETAYEEDAPQADGGEWWLDVGARGMDQGLVDMGYLVEWDWNYYCAHSYTSYGEVIAALQAGDVVHIDGGTVLICGADDFLADGYVWDVREVYPDAVIFQTCYIGGSDYVMIKYGYWQ